MKQANTQNTPADVYIKQFVNRLPMRLPNFLCGLYLNEFYPDRTEYLHKYCPITYDGNSTRIKFKLKFTHIFRPKKKSADLPTPCKKKFKNGFPGN